MKLSSGFFLFIVVCFFIKHALADDDKASLKVGAEFWAQIGSGDLTQGEDAEGDKIFSQIQWSLPRVRSWIQAEVGKKFKAKVQVSYEPDERVKIKDVYMTWAVLDHFFGFTVGHQKTQMWGFSEKAWGQRELSGGNGYGKTVMHHSKWAASREYGIVLHSKPLDLLKLNAFFMNATSSIRTEGATGVVNKENSYHLGLNTTLDFKPIEVYFFYANQRNLHTAGLASTLKLDLLTVASEFYLRGAKKSFDEREVGVFDLLTSVYSVIRMPTLDWLSFMARYDLYRDSFEATPNSGDKTEYSSIGHRAIFGVKFRPHKIYSILVSYVYDSGAATESITGNATRTRDAEGDNYLDVVWKIKF